MPKGERFLFDVSFDEENLALDEADFDNDLRDQG